MKIISKAILEKAREIKKLGGREQMGVRELYSCELCDKVVEYDPVFYNLVRNEFRVYNVTCPCGGSNQIKNKGMGIEIIKRCSCTTLFVTPEVLNQIKSAQHKKTHLTICKKCAGEDIDKFFTIKKI